MGKLWIPSWAYEQLPLELPPAGVFVLELYGLAIGLGRDARRGYLAVVFRDNEEPLAASGWLPTAREALAEVVNVLEIAPGTRYKASSCVGAS